MSHFMVKITLIVMIAGMINLVFNVCYIILTQVRTERKHCAVASFLGTLVGCMLMWGIAWLLDMNGIKPI
jgi:ACR3 family arsenite efflux pump ArsB